MLRGHDRSITQVKYNADGDLLFSSSKDSRPTVWYADSGERLGTYGEVMHAAVKIIIFSSFFIAGHTGAVWDIDPSWDSQYVLTAGADGSARLFECTSGKCLAKMPHKG